MKNHLLLLLLFTLKLTLSQAQVGIGTTTPDPSAQLEVVSTDKGVLVSRVTSTSLVNSPAKGLLVYQTSGSEGFYYFDGGAWQKVGKDTPPPGTTFAFASNSVPISSTISGTGYIFKFGVVQIVSGISANIDNTAFNLAAPGFYSISYNLAMTVPATGTEIYYAELLINGEPAVGSQADSNTIGPTRFILTNYVVPTFTPTTTVSVRLIGPSGAVISSNKLQTLSIIRLR